MITSPESFYGGTHLTHLACDRSAGVAVTPGSSVFKPEPLYLMPDLIRG